MKKLTSILLMMLVLLSCGTASAQEEEQNPEDVYWFFIRMRLDPKRKDIEITGGGTKITMGTIKGFDKAVWKGIARRQVAIGPFHSEAEALNAKIYYKKSKDKINELPQATAPSNMSWFEVSFKELKRLNSYEYTHSPAAVTDGTSAEFTDALFEALSFQRLSIGPFWDHTQAEEAKKIYRKNE